MVIGSLCSGYGGLDMGLQAVVGGTVAWHFEYDKHAAKILDHNYPGIPNHGDITATNWDLPAVDWITAGYPCQPFSAAGKRKGTSDARHIWPFIKDGIRILRPRGVLLENVAGHLSLGFGDVLGDLAAIGYDAKWICIRASDAGAPHLRQRVFILAHPNRKHDGQGQHRDLGTPGGKNGRQHANGIVGSSTQGDALEIDAYGEFAPAIRRWADTLGVTPPTPLNERGKLQPAFVEWMMGVPNGWVTNAPISREAQLKALGNGVVPQQAALALRLMGVGQ